MPPTLPKNIYFTVSSNKTKKYTAHLPSGKNVHFGARGYQHYKDQVPKKLGGGKWSNKDHLDPKRRKNYRARHAGVINKDGKRAIDVKYSPAWFSYYFLW
jgi:hypothetical protein